ncbi:MAG: hypothetical protein A2X94_09815 [Bdellovibrionales bacterium GWB1_55_8]|nr:MAG: hypothetical protein A2X94_09815 [Bdellovibrionales bacterium GWB1_55_8]
MRRASAAALRQLAALCFFVLASGVVLAGCAAAPVAPPSPAEQARAELQLGTELEQRLESQLRIVRDPEITIYLRGVAEKLLKARSSGDPAFGVLVIKQEQGPWRNLGIPGNRIYLSAGLLKTIEYENELAAALAMEIAHISRKHLMRRIQESMTSDVTLSTGLNNLDFFSPGGAFIFTEADHLGAIEDAFDILYRAGFDPRGLSSLISIYQKNSTRSPYESSTTEKLLAASRKVIARTAPLRNPILRTPEFREFQKRMKRQ